MSLELIYARDIIGIALGLIILMVFIFKGVSIYVTGLVAVVVLAIVSGVGYSEAVSAWLGGWTSYLSGYLVVFLMGGFFGKMMELTGAAISVARFLIKYLGNAGALLAVGVTAAIMTYGGVSIFISCTAVIPIVLEIFKKANIPHRFMPAILLYGAYSIGHQAPGNPTANNLIPYQYLNQLDPSVTMMSGLVIGWAICIGEFILSWWLLRRMIKKAQARGESFSMMPGEFAADEDVSLPNPIVSLIPLVSVVVFCNLRFNGTDLFQDKSIAIFCSCILCLLVGFKYLNWKKDFLKGIADSAVGTISMITGMCSIIGFASVVAKTDSFSGIVSAIMGLPGTPLISAFVFVSLLCAITGSGSGGIGIVAPIVAEEFMAKGVSMRALCRVMCMSSVGLDSLPHNGAVVGVTRTCHETTAASYWPICVVTVLVTAGGAFLAAILFSIFPGLP